jgi:hypothetical protein
MNLSLRTRKTNLIKAGFITCAALLAVLAPAAMHASPVTYNLTLTPIGGTLYGGTGSLSIEPPAPSGTSAYFKGTIDSLNFLVDGQTFTLAGSSPSIAIFFHNGSFTEMEFFERLGTSPNLFTLDIIGDSYTFGYNNETAYSNGTVTASLADGGTKGDPSPVPEPAPLALLATGLLGGASTLYRRLALRRN